MIALFCGSRNYTDKSKILTVMQALQTQDNDLVIVNGGARGADKLSQEVAELLGLTTSQFFPDWEQHGKAAGPIRNKQMLDENEIDLVVAFTDNMEESKGTANMIGQSRKRNIRVIVVGDVPDVQVTNTQEPLF